VCQRTFGITKTDAMYAAVPTSYATTSMIPHRRTLNTLWRSQMSESSRGPPRLRAAATLTGALLLVAACASTPPAPTATLQAAQQAISNAEQADAGRYAAAELGEARTKLASANDAVKEEKMINAERLGQQSRAEAELASARSEAAKAAEINKELQRGNDALVEETQRNSGEPQ
jgi:Domain of unknown function (DUF4398)